MGKSTWHSEKNIDIRCFAFRCSNIWTLLLLLWSYTGRLPLGVTLLVNIRKFHRNEFSAIYSILNERTKKRKKKKKNHDCQSMGNYTGAIRVVAHLVAMAMISLVVLIVWASENWKYGSFHYRSSCRDAGYMLENSHAITLMRTTLQTVTKVIETPLFSKETHWTLQQ